ncbi:MAG: TadE family protein [Pseudomonadota bacterium]
MATNKALRQGPERGGETIEFALVSLVFLTLVFGMLEFGRMLYLYNTMQEVTRRAAREAVTRWVDQGATVKSLALFGASSVPAGPEITSANITITYWTKSPSAQVDPMPADPGDNIVACSDVTRAASCIDSVQVSIDGVKYAPMTPLFGILNIDGRLDMPKSTVRMHAESLGFNNE